MTGITEAYKGSATVSTTEWDLPTNTSTLSSLGREGVYQVFIDFSELTATESYELRMYEKVTGSADQRLIFLTTLSGVQSEPLYVTPSLLLIHGWTVTLKKAVGTDRALTWSIRRIN